jgi:hypothetical protein
MRVYYKYHRRHELESIDVPDYFNVSEILGHIAQKHNVSASDLELKVVTTGNGLMFETLALTAMPPKQQTVYVINTAATLVSSFLQNLVWFVTLGCVSPKTIDHVKPIDVL